MAPLIAAADVTIPDEYAKLIQQHSRIATLDGGFFGDQVGLSTGSLEIVQTDLDLPGNQALPVRVGRRFEPGSYPAVGQFSDWDLDIPHLHGTFGGNVGDVGWYVDSVSNRDHRCSEFGPPPEVFIYGTEGSFTADEFWHGTSFYLPGSGDQELLLGGDVPSTGGPYTATTREGSVARCLTTLAATSESGSTGEGFEIVTPDGTVYTFNQMVSRNADSVHKADPSTVLMASRSTTSTKATLDPQDGTDSTQSVACCTVQRREFFLYPTKVTDRFGNTVTYTWSASNPWRLLSIAASDGRTINLSYSSSDAASILVQSISSGGRTWSYTYGNGLTAVTQPDQRSWQFSLYDFNRYAKPTPQGTTCDAISNPGSSSWIGSITAPTGAVAQYTLTETLFGRSWGVRDCKVDGSGNESISDPYLFVGVAITAKTISGPGLPSGGLSWAYAYGAPNNCWDPSGVPTGDPDAVICSGSSPVTRSTTVTEPDGAVSRYTFGNRIMEAGGLRGNEGLMRVEEHGVSGATALRTTNIEYGLGEAVPYGSHQGQSLRRAGDWRVSGQRRPQLSVITSLQGATFSWTVPKTCANEFCFDTRARPTTIVRAGPNAAARTETTSYYDDTSQWVLGQVAQVKCIGSTSECAASGTVMSETTYDVATALPLTTKAFGKLKSTFSYDMASAASTGQRATLKTVKDGNNNVTTYTSWKRGIPQSVAFADSTARSAVVDDSGWITSVTDENGYTTGYAYDAMGRITQVNYPTGDSVAWAATNSIFEPVATAEQGVGAGHWRETTHTGNGYKVTLFDALWRPVLAHEYDAGASGTDRWVATAYDKAGRVVDASYPLATAPTMASNGTWLLSGVRPTGVRTGYDTLGRPTSVVQDAEAPFGTLTTTTEYLTNFQRRTTDARGNATTESFMAWDSPSFDLPIQIDAPENQHTAITRDAYGKPTAITRGAIARTYGYNASQELCKAQEPETGVTVMGYDGAGNLGWSASGLPAGTDCSSDGNTTAINARKAARTYDARNRISTLVFPDVNGNQSWTYTPDGLPATVTTFNDGGTTSVVNTYLYNKRRLLTGESQAQTGNPDTWSVGYGYSTTSAAASLTYPTGLTLTLSPNALGQPTLLAGATQTFASGISYWPNGALKQFTYGNGIVHTLTQNARGLPQVSKDANGATAILQDEYAYDAVGNVLSITDAATGRSQRGNRDMGYDGLNRLTSAASPMFGTATYAYGVQDNLTHVQVTGGSQIRDQGYVYDGSNRLTNITVGGASVIGLGYDVQGNLSNKNGTLYGFDYGNRMRSGGPETYRYDAYGRRARSINSSGGILYSLYGQGGQLLWQRDQRTNQRRNYVYLQSSLLAEQRRPIGSTTETIIYQHTDALGSPVATTNSAKTVLQRSEYEPYGYQLTPVLADGPGYTGHAVDAATGLVYMQQRYYDPLCGCFVSTDPVPALSGPFNRYWYANANPYKFEDLDGRLPSWATQLIDAVKSMVIRQAAEATSKFIQAVPDMAKATIQSHLNKNVYTVGLSVSGTAGTPIVGNKATTPSVFVTGGLSATVNTNGQFAASASWGTMAGFGGGAMAGPSVIAGRSDVGPASGFSLADVSSHSEAAVSLAEVPFAGSIGIDKTGGDVSGSFASGRAGPGEGAWIATGEQQSFVGATPPVRDRDE